MIPVFMRFSFDLLNNRLVEDAKSKIQVYASVQIWAAVAGVSVGLHSGRRLRVEGSVMGIGYSKS